MENMEEIYVNVEHVKSVDSRPSTNQTGPRSSERRFHGAVVLCLGLLSVFLLAGLIGLGVHYLEAVHGLTEELPTIKANLTEERDLLKANLTETTKELQRLQSLSKQNSDVIHGLTEELSTIKANLTEERDLLKANLTETTKELHRLQSLSEQNSDVIHGLTEERNLLNANLTETTKELQRLQSLSEQKKTCPAGWTMFSCTCYLISTNSDSWDNGRQDCRGRGGDLVVIESREEQNFITNFAKQTSWIGLSDRGKEGTWKWTDGTLPHQTYWGREQPDNGGGDPMWGEEDCGTIDTATNNWNDLRCDALRQWICEKIP